MRGLSRGLEGRSSTEPLDGLELRGFSPLASFEVEYLCPRGPGLGGF